MVAIGSALALAAFVWAFWAVGILFEDGELCVGNTIDVAQQSVAIAGFALAVAALAAALRARTRSWLYRTLAGGATFLIWEIGLRIAENQNC